jgi:hypothetical protein
MPRKEMPEGSVPSGESRPGNGERGGRNADVRQSVFKGTLEKRSGINVIKSLKTSSATIAKPSLITLASSRVAGTELIRDRIRPQLPQLWMPWCSTFGPVMAGTNYFQDGTNLDTVVNTQLGPVFKQMYSAIVRELQIVSNRFIRDTVLDNSGTITDSFGYWVSGYSEAFTTLRGLQGALYSGSFNYSASLLANSINQNLPALEGALRMLYTFSVPPMLVRFLERMLDRSHLALMIPSS